MLKVVSNGVLVALLPKEISSPSWKQGEEGHAEVTLCGELIDWSSPNCGPHKCSCGGSLSLFNCLVNCLLLSQLVYSIKHKLAWKIYSRSY